MTNKSTLHIIAVHAGKAIEPLKTAVSSFDNLKSFLYEMGWDATSFPGAFPALTSSINQAVTSAKSLPSNPSIQAVQNLFNDIKQVYVQVKNIGTAPTAAPVATAFLNEFPKRLAELLAVKYISSEIPHVYSLLRTLGIIQPVFYEATAQRPAFTRQEFRFEYVEKFIANPTELLKLLYGWGLNELDFDRVAGFLRNFFVSKGIPASFENADRERNSGYGYVEDAMLENARKYLRVPLYTFYSGGQFYQLGFELFKYVNNDKAGLVLQPLLPTQLTQTITLNSNATLVFKANSNLSTLFGVDINPDGVNVIYPGQTNVALPEAGFGATLQYLPPDSLILLGRPGASRLEITGADFSFLVNYAGSTFDVQLDADLKGFKLVLTGGDGDGFISKILGSVEKVIDLELGITWSNSTGLQFRGSGGFEIDLNPHIQLGPLEIQNMKIGLYALPGTPSKVKLEAGAGVKLVLGPFTAVIDGVGINLLGTFTDGNAGPFDIGVGFKPPTGLGLSIDSGTVKGAGYLSFNVEESRYVGALELTIKDEISVKAIGILTTKLPGNQPGYSLLLLITAEFQPVQLGFGFTLNGVGGLIALNRKMNFDALRDGVRNNSLSHILFPTDPVGNINSIVSSLESVFPIAEGFYVFGPMAIIGWGTPTLITAEVGLFIELPGPRIAIIGIIKALLPDESRRILQLQINFAGTIDFEAQFITFDASLFDSKLLWLPLTGDMAFRLKWGDNAAFVLSVGGFYPGFPVPPLNIPNLNRITVNLLDGDNPRLTLSTYFAVTSNTVQFGAAIDFYYKYSGKITVEGGVGFDALFRFSPFHFTSTIRGNLTVYWKGDSIVSIWFEGNLDGPTPWHLQGTAGFKIWKINYEVDFDRTFGDYQNTTLEDIEVLPMLNAALVDKKNWQARTPENTPQLVTVRELPDDPGKVVVHPQGRLAVNQKVVPLNFTISRYGNRRPKTYRRFSISLSHAPSDTPYTSGILEEYFAPGEFVELSQDERLYRKSFEKYTSGAQVTNVLTGLESGAFYMMPQEYKTILMDSKFKPVPMPAEPLDNIQNQALMRGGSAANSPLGTNQSGRSYNAPMQVIVEQQQYAVAQTYNGAVFNSQLTNGQLIANSEAEAYELLYNELTARPELQGALHVIPSYEL